jgi:dihydrolipoamide dehydrogenase
MADLTCKLLVIGAGPGGYVCAIRAAQHGVDTILVESGELGGTCLNVGCIPSKALIHVANDFYKLRLFATQSPMGISASAPAIDQVKTRDWIASVVDGLSKGVAGLLKKAGVRCIRGEARFRDGKTVFVKSAEGEGRIRAEAIVVATGSEPVELPSIPFGGNVLSSTEALTLREIPRRLAVVGAGYIGLEIGTAYAKLGTEVTIVEAADRILPQYDASLVAPVRRRLDRLGVRVMTSAKAESWSDRCLVASRASENPTLISADKVLVAVGRRPRTEPLDLETLRLAMNGPFVRVDDRCRTSMRGIFAIGDVTGEPMLAHRAMAQGEMVADAVAGQPAIWDKIAVPAVCFTDPEIVAIGQGPDQVKAAGIDAIVAEFPFRANGRALASERGDGFVRVLARKDNGVLLGLQAVGESVSELSAAFGLALEMGARLEDVAATIHAHPTRSEAFHETCLKALGRPLHA